MKTIIQKFRVWLKNNKIFFETITAVSLSIMAIVVSWQANQIASYQASLTKSERLPFFRFEIDQRIIAHDDLIIYNERSQLSEFKCKAYIFWQIDYGKEGKGLVSAKIPVIDYYPLGVITNQSVGELVRLSWGWGSGGNGQKVIELDREFTALARKNNSLGFISIERYIWVKYKDIWGELHEEMYSVDNLGGRKLSKIEEEGILKDYKNKIEQQIYINLSNASAESLYEKWKVASK